MKSGESILRLKVLLVLLKNSNSSESIDPKTRENRKKAGGNRKKQYQEGWVEFMDKKVGKTVAATLNNQIIGGKKSNYYHDDIWNLKYLPRFKWIHLNEQLAYERQERQKTIQIETDQAKREVDVYLKNFAKSKKRIRAAQTDNDGEGRPVKNFRQREAVEDEPLIDQAILKKLI